MTPNENSPTVRNVMPGRDAETRERRIVNRSARQSTSPQRSREPNLSDAARSIVLQELGRMSYRPTCDGLPRHVEDALVDVVCREVCRRRGGNDVVNRLEAEALVNTILHE